MNGKLGQTLVLDELFDLTLYQRLLPFAGKRAKKLLQELIPVETQHLAFWQQFFKIPEAQLDFPRRVKMVWVVALCRLFGDPAIFLVLEAIEVHGIKKYLQVWERYKREKLGKAVKSILEDEFGHEDSIVTESMGTKISGSRIRNIFLGFNDGLVEILGAVSGFFAAFAATSSVLIASTTVAIAGSISMAAGILVAEGSEREIFNVQKGKKKFLGEPMDDDDDPGEPWTSSVLVGMSYLAGACIPVLPVLFGAQTILAPVIIAGITIMIVSYLLAFLSGMDVKRRIVINLLIIGFAVTITYFIGTLANNVWGV